jgi:protoporphyrinogen oxidase
MWECVANNVKNLGGEIRLGARVVELRREDNRITEVVVASDRGREVISADFVFSSTDVQSLLRMMRPCVPEEVRAISDALEYRDFLTVGLLLETKPKDLDGFPIADTWLYIHEPGVHVGRVQMFHNWHPRLVANPACGWIGLEYFVNVGDPLWNMPDHDLIRLGVDELDKIGLRQGIGVIDGTVIRQSKAYPGYFGSYARFADVRAFLDTIENLFPVGRNGMHRYNNQDHSMLAAMAAVDNIVEGRTDKSKLWAINSEQEYHEEKKRERSPADRGTLRPDS